MTKNFYSVFLVIFTIISSVKASKKHSLPYRKERKLNLNRQSSDSSSNGVENSSEQELFNLNYTNKPIETMPTKKVNEKKLTFIEPSCCADQNILKKLQGPIGTMLQKIFLTQRDAYQLLVFFNNFYKTDDDDIYIIGLLSLLKGIHLYNLRPTRGTSVSDDYVILPNLADIANLTTAHFKWINLNFDYKGKKVNQNYTPCSYNYIFINACSLYYTLLTAGPRKGIIMSKDNLSTKDFNGILKLVFKFFTQMYNVNLNLNKNKEPKNECNQTKNENANLEVDPRTYMYVLMDFLKFMSIQNKNQKKIEMNKEKNQNVESETEFYC